MFYFNIVEFVFRSVIRRLVDNILLIDVKNFWYQMLVCKKMRLTNIHQSLKVCFNSF